MDAFTPLVVAAGASAAVAAARGRLLRNPWNLMLLAKANYRRALQPEDGVRGGAREADVSRLAARHFGGTLEGVTIGDLFPVLCSDQWREAMAVIVGCLMRHHRIPRSFRLPPSDQYAILRALWVPRRSRLRHYVRPGTALDYLQLAYTYSALPVQAEDGVIERVPADWFRDYLRAHDVAGEHAPIGLLLRAVRPGDDSPSWHQHAASARRCITGRLKREGVLDPDFDDDVPALRPAQLAEAQRAGAHPNIPTP